jgi:predicted NBD/HSP70 family sugar kinase
VTLNRDAVGQRSETVRRANLSAIVRELHLHGPLSRSNLVTRTGLTRSAIRALIGEFVGAGIVSEERSAPLGAPGRPSPVVRPDPESSMVVALEISVDSLAVALVGFGGKVLELERVDRPRAHLSVDDIVADLADRARPLLKRVPATGALLGVGVAVVGVVRRTDGFVRMAPNLGWKDVPLGDVLRRALGLRVPISLANEADLGALAEHRRGAAAGVDDVLYISGEVGVGGGLIVGGRPLTGAAGYGGEVGHIPINHDGAACRCGSVGCWETEVGEMALLRRAGHAQSGGREGVEAVLRDAAGGWDAALGALDEVGRWLGIGLAGLVNVFNPQLVVLGGLFQRIHPFVARTIELELDRLALPVSRSLVRVVPSALAADAPLIGAAEMAFEAFLADPAIWLRDREALAVVQSA